MKFLKTHSSSYYILYTIFLLFFSHTIFYLENLSILLIILLITFVLLNLYFSEISFPKFNIEISLKDLKLSNLLILLIIILPSVFFINNVSFGDFNWGGDHRDFVLASLVNNEFWFSSITSERDTIENFNIKHILFSFFKIRIFLLFLLIGITIFLYKKNYGNLANIFLLIVFYIWSSVDIINVEKDPRGSFFLSLPFNSIFYFFQLNLMDAIRFTNFISIIFWLLILRPIIIGEYPNLKILPFALIIYWNPQMIYIVNGGFTEPWSIIFLLLAIELIIKKKYNFAPQAVILIGIGTCFKAPIALLLPCFFLYGKPWIKNQERRLKHILSFISSTLPIYFFTKLRVSNNWDYQPFKLENYGFNHINKDYLDLAYIQLDNYKYLILIFIICIYFFFKNFRENKWESSFFLLTSFFIFSVYFFNDLAHMHQHVLWFRYFMWSYIMLFGFIIIKTINFEKKYLVLISLTIAFIYSSELIKFLKINKNNLYEMNFYSFNTVPLFLGLEPLIKENKEILDKKNIDQVKISRSTEIVYRIPHYLFKDIKIETTAPSEIVCECSEKNNAIVNFFPKGRRGVNLNYRIGMPVWPEGWNELYGDNLETSKNQCLNKMKNTCPIVRLLKEKDNTTIAALGIH